MVRELTWGAENEAESPAPEKHPETGDPSPKAALGNAERGKLGSRWEQAQWKYILHLLFPSQPGKKIYILLSSLITCDQLQPGITSIIVIYCMQRQ